MTVIGAFKNPHLLYLLIDSHCKNKLHSKGYTFQGGNVIILYELLIQIIGLRI